MALSLLLFARVPVDGNFLVDVLPVTLAVGLKAGIAFNPMLLAAMSGVAPEESGLASGVVNTAFMMGGAPGLAVLEYGRFAYEQPARLRTRVACRNQQQRTRGLPAENGFIGASAVIAAALLKATATMPHPEVQPVTETA